LIKDILFTDVVQKRDVEKSFERMGLCKGITVELDMARKYK